MAWGRVCKFAYAKLYERQTADNALSFLKEVKEKFVFKIHTILTDNGAQFTYQHIIKTQRPKKYHGFDLLCKKYGIRHRLTKFRHPWTNGQVERFNRSLKDAGGKKIL